MSRRWGGDKGANRQEAAVGTADLCGAERVQRVGGACGPMADVATPGAAASSTLNHTGLDKDTPSGKAGREKVAIDGEGKRDPLPADEFTKATFTAAQKVLREQRSRAPVRSLSCRPCCPAARPCCP